MKMKAGYKSSKSSLAFTVLFFGTILFCLLANGWVHYKASDYLHANRADVGVKQAAIVPGAQVFSDGRTSLILKDRLAAALELYQANKVKKIIVSGDHGSAGYDEVNTMWRWLRKRGVPEADIFLDHAGFRTFDTMLRARKVFQVESAVVCTQQFHLPRAVFLARRSGIDAVGFSGEPRIYSTRHINTIREFIARIVAVMDTYIWAREPRFEGLPIPITGNAKDTHDQWTVLLGDEG